MTDAIAATFCELRSIKGRKQTQLVFEIPAEETDRALAVLGGYPRFDNPKWCGIALLADRPPEWQRAAIATAESRGESPAISPGRKFHDLQYSQQAGLLCNDLRFRNYLRTGNPCSEKEAADYVRQRCGVKSRSELDLPENENARLQWRSLVRGYRQWAGLDAEERG